MGVWKKSVFEVKVGKGADKPFGAGSQDRKGRQSEGGFSLVAERGYPGAFQEGCASDVSVLRIVPGESSEEEVSKCSKKDTWKELKIR